MESMNNYLSWKNMKKNWKIITLLAWVWFSIAWLLSDDNQTILLEWCVKYDVMSYDSAYDDFDDETVEKILLTKKEFDLEFRETIWYNPNIFKYSICENSNWVILEQVSPIIDWWISIEITPQ